MILLHALPWTVLTSWTWTFDNQRSKSKTDLNYLIPSSLRIPVVTRPYIHNLNQPTFPTNILSFSLVTPLPHEISQLLSSGRQGTEQNVAIRAENNNEAFGNILEEEKIIFRKKKKKNLT